MAEYDLVVRGGMVLDGTGSPGRTADVAVTAGDSVVEVTVTDDGPGLGAVPSQTSLGLATTRALVASCTGSSLPSMSSSVT